MEQELDTRTSKIRETAFAHEGSITEKVDCEVEALPATLERAA